MADERMTEEHRTPPAERGKDAQTPPNRDDGPAEESKNTDDLMVDLEMEDRFEATDN